jgi:hypothetical protein
MLLDTERLKKFGQINNVTFERSMTDIEPVAHGKLFEVLGQLISRGHLGAIQQDGDHRDVVLKGRPDLDSHKIARVI